MSDPRSTAPSAAADAPSATPAGTDLARLRALSDADAEMGARRDPDNPPASDAWLASARVVTPPEKQPVSLRLDADVLAWFRAQGEGYQTQMNAVLRAFYEHHRNAASR